MTSLFVDAPAFFFEAVKKSGINCLKRQENLLVWQQVLNNTHYIPTHYSCALIDFYLAYQNGQSLECIDISFILEYDGQPCAVWPLSLSLKNQSIVISSHGLAILPPLFTTHLSRKLQKKLVKICQKILVEFCQRANISAWDSAESFSGIVNPALSEWQIQSMNLGVDMSLGYDMFIDLADNITQIKSGFRKSYKSLISSGLRMWDISVVTQENSKVWGEFQAFHVAVAGKETRCAQSWDVQHKAIIEGDAFLVILRDKDGMMVGAGFFSITRDEGSYGVGVYNRVLFDKPLGHVVQYRAIEEMQSRGIRWYKVGIMAYPVADYTAKEASISHFKQGFANHVFPRYQFSYNT
jgi:FemAB family protein